MKKKVLFIIRSFNAGGTEISLLNLLKSRKDFEPTVLALYGTGSLRRDFETIARCVVGYDMQKKHLPGAGRLYGWILHHVSSSLLHELMVRDAYDIEVAYMNGIPARLVSGSKQNNEKWAWFHMGYPENSTILDVDLQCKSAREIANRYNRFDKYICVSSAQAKTLRRITAGYVQIDDSNLKVVHNVLDKNAILEKSNTPIQLPAVTQPPVFVCCARLEAEKGIDRLLTSAAILKNKGYRFSVWIIGTGTKFSEYADYIAKNDLTECVYLAGYQSNPYPYLKNADVYISPSRLEGYGLSIAEAMILGMRIISTDCEGPREIMRDYPYGSIIENTDDAVFEAMRNWIRETQNDIEESFVGEK